MTAPFLVLGASGQLGRAFLAHFAREGQPAIGLGRAEFDLGARALPELPAGQFRAILNCAAYTAVDAAETDEAAATRVNGTAVSELARVARARGVPLVTYSTDYVFDGTATEPYAVDAERAPKTAYGRSKLVGERLLEAGAGEAGSGDWLLVRTSWVYAPYGNNFLRTMAKLVKERDEVKVVMDQRGRPTHVDTLVEGTLALLDRSARGIYHLTDDGEVTWFEFARAIRDILGAKAQVTACTTADFPRPAPRPAYSVLDLGKTEALIGRTESFETRLASAVKALE